ncbi:MAG: hypothetical protein V2A66_07395 [Pseudomonadota bacterium]
MKKMKIILFLFLMMLAFQASAQELSNVDRVQAEWWMTTIRVLWKVGDYPTLRYYCQKVVQYYPETDYAVEAQKYLTKSEKPKKNKRRERIRNDPALTFGM